MSAQRASLRAIATAAALLVGLGLARTRYLRWGATDDETTKALPGDELVADADIIATRGVTIAADPDAVWPWIAQLGQGRGGFYSYDFLENLAGCDIHSANRIVPEWQSVALGDEVRLHPEIGLRIAGLEPGRAMVLQGGVPMGRVPPPYDCTWAFILVGQRDGSTRLLMRERYGYTRWWSALLVEPVQLISFVMSARMLRGIRMRVQRADETPAERFGPGSAGVSALEVGTSRAT
jgi:hypothetical protein